METVSDMARLLKDISESVHKFMNAKVFHKVKSNDCYDYELLTTTSIYLIYLEKLKFSWRG